MIKPDLLLVIFIHGYCAFFVLAPDSRAEHNNLLFSVIGYELRLPGLKGRTAHSERSQID